MFRVKICGITSIDDALVAADAGAGAIGLNFYSASPRYCPLETAKAIAAAVPAGVCKVGVFVDATADEIRRAAELVGLDLVQLHGDEPAELLRAVRPLAVMRAFRAGSDFSAVGDYLRACHVLRCLPRMVLIDAMHGDQYGGTGTTFDWHLLDTNRFDLLGIPLVLAGGLNPTNVAQAISIARPWAVDVASGVELSPGKKSPQLVRDFVAAAKAALAQAATRKERHAEQ
jgi:phosphoribosylanthranilate isomerase